LNNNKLRKNTSSGYRGKKKPDGLHSSLLWCWR